MVTQSLESVLRNHAFLSDLSPEHIQTIISCASNQRFEKDDLIAREGTEADSFYLIRSGTVALQIHRPESGGITLNTLGESDVLGWSWLVPPHRWHFDARVMESTRVIALDGRCLRNKCEQDHELGYHLLKRFSTLIEDRLEATRLQLLDVYGVPAR
ncbi:MAG TPA: cyclic nucleotide-binding domain-containing protein [Bryobacteraceae bacterium]|nr:cyclic nucleotide-binding domain-containing protein [Bryobacteraceae bacterium]